MDQDSGLKEGRERWRGLYLSLAPSGLIIYMGFLWTRFGDPLFFYYAQKNWQREATGPLVTATRAWQTAVDGLNILREPGALGQSLCRDPSGPPGTC
jgi:hypothetical protein